MLFCLFCDSYITLNDMFSLLNNNYIPINFFLDESDTPTGSPVEEPDMTSSSSEGEGDDITLNLRENPTPLPHPSPQHAKPQQHSPHRPSSQNTAPQPQMIIEGASPAPPRKLSTPFYTGSGAVTPADSPSVARRPLVYTQHTQG